MEFFFEKNFGEVLDQYKLPIRRNFEYLEKNGVFKFFKSLYLQVFRASCPTLVFEWQLKSWVWPNFSQIIYNANQLDDSLYFSRSYQMDRASMFQKNLWEVLTLFDIVLIKFLVYSTIDLSGLVVMWSASCADGPGSIPGPCNIFCRLCFIFLPYLTLQKGTI